MLLSFILFVHQVTESDLLFLTGNLRWIAMSATAGYHKPTPIFFPIAQVNRVEVNLLLP